MKILVTGASGFIGNYIIPELIESGQEVVATSSDMEKVKEKLWISLVNYISFDFKNFDDTVNYYKYFNDPDILIHLAWEGLPNYSSEFHVNENLPRHKAFLNNLIRNGLKDLTVTGTCLEYGMQEGCLSEAMPVMPANPYAIAKDQLRQYLESLKAHYSFDLKWIRLFYMYGKGQNPNSLLSQLDKALENKENTFNMSGGEQVRDFLPVEKVAEYVVAIALQKKVSGIINCCSGNPVTVKEFVVDYLRSKHQDIHLNLGYYPYPSYEPMKFWGDNKKLKTIINS